MKPVYYKPYSKWSPAERRRSYIDFYSEKRAEPTDYEHAVLSVLANMQRGTAGEIAIACNSERHAVGAACSRLLRKGFIERHADDPVVGKVTWEYVPTEQRGW